MTDNHPITPPDELVQQWYDAARGPRCEQELATQAARWGADMELEACIDWISVWHGLEHPELLIELLRAARRSKPPSLKEQALKELVWIDEHLGMPLHNHCNAIHTIRRALEALPDD